MNRQILSLAIPNIITNVTVPLLGMADTAIAGHMESDLLIGAVAVASVIFSFIYWNFSFLRMGTSGFTAQACGAGDERESVNILLRSLSVALTAGAVIILLQSAILYLAFLFIKAGPETARYASEYFRVYIWAAPFVLCMYSLTGWFIGMQDARSPMFTAIATNIINIALSLFFVFVLEMGIRGLALGTALAQVCGLGIAGVIWLKKYGRLKQYLSLHFIRRLDEFKPFFKVNGNIFLRSFALILVSMFFISASAKMGDITLAVNSLLIQLFSLFSYMMDGFAYAAEALAGRYYGAKDRDTLAKIVRRLFVWGGGITAAFTAVYALLAGGILGLLTNKIHIVAAAADYKIWAVLFPIAGFAAFLWDGIFIGVTASRQMRNSMFSAVAVFFAFYFLFAGKYGNDGLWFSFISYLAMRGIMQTLMFKKIIKYF
ncbi:MATE family efflux transporter [Parelusimicrobium proximum]|uniref:MATE family efflux transporter n=1 Tax=Parelusimicrobium proximum TaxID=3228953 RepID=UPI003D166367